MRNNRRANRDPYWLTARYTGRCAQCEATIRRGDRAFYYPAPKTLLCDGAACGQAGANAMRAERSYDAYGTDCALDH